MTKWHRGSVNTPRIGGVWLLQFRWAQKKRPAIAGLSIPLGSIDYRFATIADEVSVPRDL